MGFYGNITNTSRTQFQFDKVYSSRYLMDLACKSDGVYPGRYVLVEYGSTESDYQQSIEFNDEFRPIYLYNNIPYAGLSTTNLAGTSIYTGGVEAEKILIVDKNKEINESALIMRPGDIFIVKVGNRVSDLNAEVKYLKFEEGVSKKPVEVTELSNLAIVAELAGAAADDAEFNAEWETISNDFVVRAVNGKYYFGISSHSFPNGAVINFTQPGVVERLVWKLPVGGTYSTNDTDEYYRVEAVEESLGGDGIYSEANFVNMSGVFDSSYSENYNTDKEFYNTSRGYDSTVWQKTFVSGVEKYVMVAELNTVVPTFDIVNDAPSLIPLTPHFDGSSTNVYYRLHWQPSWAIRTKSAISTLKGPQISKDGDFSANSNVTLTIDETNYPSDQDAQWKGTFYNTLKHTTQELIYNPITSKWEEYQEDLKPLYNVPAAIYYNKDGFKDTKVSESTDITDKAGWDPKEDRVGFFPTGLSGHLYNVHDNTFEGKAVPDTQEFVMMLPSLGNAMSSIWDIIYGGRDTNAVIEATSRRNKDIAWEDGVSNPARKGLRLRGLTNNYNINEVNTVAGSINSMHDLMGMIIFESENFAELENNADNLSKDKIYFSKEKQEYYRKHLKYDYTDLGASDFNYVAITGDLSAEEKLNYYVRRGTSYVPAAGRTDIGASEVFYKKRVKDTDLYTEVNLSDFNSVLNNNGNAVYFKEYKKSSFNASPETADYIIETTDQCEKEKLFYTLTGLTPVDIGDDYEPDKYYYLEDNMLLLDSAPQANMDNETGEPKSKSYYILEDGFNFTDFPTYPTEYDPGLAITNTDIHAIYRPNTYFYREGNNNFVLDTNLNASNGLSYYTFDAAQVEEEEDATPLYQQKINFEIAPIYNSGANTPNANLYYKNYYYYLDASDAELSSVTWADIVANAVPESKFKIAREDFSAYYSNGQWSTNIKTVNANGKTVGLFQKKLRYELNNTILYEIVNKQIGMKKFNNNSGSVFVPVFENEGSALEKCIGIRFLNQNELPITLWKRDGGDYSLVLLNPETKEEYPPEQKFYYFGINTGLTAGGSSQPTYELLTLNNIASSTNPDAHKLKKLQDEFYEPNKYHYMLNNGSSKDGSFLLDTGFLAQRDENTGNLYNYYKLEADNLVLADGTYVVQDEITFNANLEDREILHLFYKDNNNKYHPVTSKARTLFAPGTKLYNIVPNTDYYKPFYYYEKVSDDTYRLIKDLSKPSLDHIYEKNSYYVSEDTSKVYQTGSEWNIEADSIPPTVTLARRTERMGIELIPELARTTNTMHGLILLINQILENKDKYTRDLQTVQGCVNTLNDIIAKFDKLKTGQFVLVDNYGKMHSAGWTTSQPYTAKNEQTSKLDISHSSAENRWISLRTNPDCDEPSFVIKHEFTPVPDTETLADKNGQAAISASMNGNNNANDDLLKLYTPIVDSKGHVVGKNTETVTLPYGFKYFHSTGTSTETDEDLNSPAASNIQADTTQDTLNVNPVNKWIQAKFSPTGTATGDGDKLELAHEIHSIDTTAKTTNLNTKVNNNVQNTLVLQDLEFDTAGHVTKNQAHTYTLPYGFKQIKLSQSPDTTEELETNTTSIIADNTQDEMTIAAANKWIRTAGTDGTANEIKVAHALTSISGNSETDYGLSSDLSVSQLDALTDNAFSVPVFQFDKAGHITKAETHTVALPDNFKTVAVNNSGNALVSFSSANGNLVADNLEDTLTMSAGNKWIGLEANATSDTVSFAHALTSATANKNQVYGENGNKALKYEGTSEFTTLNVQIDEAGHVTGLSTNTITLPNITLTSSGSGGVITGLNLNTDSSGAFTYTKSALANVAIGTALSPTLSGQSEAFGAGATLETILEALITKINSLNTTVTSQGATIASQGNTISSQATTISELQTTIGTLEGRIEALEVSIGSLEPRIEALEQAANNTP